MGRLQTILLLCVFVLLGGVFWWFSFASVDFTHHDVTSTCFYHGVHHLVGETSVDGKCVCEQREERVEMVCEQNDMEVGDCLQQSVSQGVVKWCEIDSDMALAKWEYLRGGKTGEIEIVRLRNRAFDVELRNDFEGRILSGWLELGDVLVVNGAYFAEDFTPSGYLKVDHERVGEFVFNQNESALLVVSKNTKSIRDTELEPMKPGEDFEYALQSFPLLIKDGKANVSTDSGQEARRTAIGVGGRYVYIFVVPSPHLSLYEFADEIASMGISCEDVLNLDGGSSTGLKMRYKGFRKNIPSFVPIPNVLVFGR